MSILKETRIAVDVYRYTTLEDQESILKELNHEDKVDKDSISGLIIVRHHTDSSERRWNYTTVQIIDKEEIYL